MVTENSYSGRTFHYDWGQINIKNYKICDIHCLNF